MVQAGANLEESPCGFVEFLVAQPPRRIDGQLVWILSLSLFVLQQIVAFTSVEFSVLAQGRVAVNEGTGLGDGQCKAVEFLQGALIQNPLLNKAAK